MSAASPSATGASSSSVAGFTTAKRLPDAASTRSPPITSRSGKRSRPTAPGAAVTSLPLEHGLPLLDVGRDAFLRVLALEEEVLQLALEREAGLERHLHAGDDGALDLPDGERGLVRQGELVRVEHDAVPPIFLRQHRVHEVHLLRFLEREGAAGDHQLDRL